MIYAGWIYFAFTLVLFLVFIGLIFYYYSPKRKKKVEEPKYTMLDDEEPDKEEVSHAGKRRHTGKP